MTQKLRHARVTTYRPQSDGTTNIETKSYFEELNGIKQEIQQSVRTSKATFIADMMDCIALISDGETRALKLEIEADHNHQPIRIIKTWTIRKEYYGK